MTDEHAALREQIGRVSDEWRLALAASSDDAMTQLAPGVVSIREGHRIHTRASTMLSAGVSPSLALLIGDFAYAAGLCDVAAAGDLGMVRTLAATIGDCSAAGIAATELHDVCWSGVGKSHADGNG